MRSRDFVYWLLGFFELANPKELNAEQTETIRKHLHLVFEHEIDPSFPDSETLKEIHNEDNNSDSELKVDESFQDDIVKKAEMTKIIEKIRLESRERWERNSIRGIQWVGPKGRIMC